MATGIDPIEHMYDLLLEDDGRAFYALLGSNFVNGTTITFPLWVYGAVKTGIPPQVFVMGTMIFTVGVLFAVASLVFQRKKV